MILQNRAGITKWGNCYEKVERVLKTQVTFITNWGRYKNVGQLIQGSIVQEANEKN